MNQRLRKAVEAVRARKEAALGVSIDDPDFDEVLADVDGERLARFVFSGLGVSPQDAHVMACRYADAAIEEATLEAEAEEDGAIDLMRAIGCGWLEGFLVGTYYGRSLAKARRR